MKTTSSPDDPSIVNLAEGQKQAVKKKQATRRVHQRFLWASLGSLALTVATGGIGGVVLIPVLIAWMYYAGREWMG